MKFTTGAMLWCVGMVAAVAVPGAAAAQSIEVATLNMPAEIRPAAAPVELPDSPGALIAAPAESGAVSESAPFSFSFDMDSMGQATKPASKYHRVVHPDQTVPPLTAIGKVKLSLLSRITFVDLASTALSSGISQARQTRPHYGEGAGPYGQRLGATFARQTSQSLFSYGILAAAFHDDPHYYIKGKQYSVKKRAIYAATRLVVARKDDGSAAVNFPKLLGAAASNALTNAYYPDQDRGGKVFAELYGTSLYGAVINNEVHEFLSDIVHAVFHKHS